MGEMFTYYAIADVVLMGGTWLPYGGQNFLEPMALGKPVIVGESIYNFDKSVWMHCKKRGIMAGGELEQSFIAGAAQHGISVRMISSQNEIHEILGFVMQQIGVAQSGLFELK